MRCVEEHYKTVLSSPLQGRVHVCILDKYSIFATILNSQFSTFKIEFKCVCVNVRDFWCPECSGVPALCRAWPGALGNESSW